MRTLGQSMAVLWPMLLLASCSGSADSRECRDNSDCAAGAACVADTCFVLCTTNGQCPAGLVCSSQGLCVAGGSPEAPALAGVDGTGSMDATAGHTTHHLRDRLVITGQHLAGALAFLEGINPPMVEEGLLPCSASSDTHMEVALPTAIVEGSYVLRVSNDAGSCSAGLTLLQGEPWGAQGSELVAAINTALDQDPGVPIKGTMVGKVTTLYAVGAALTPTMRSVRVQGAEQVSVSGNGLFLVVVDSITHAVVDEEVTAMFRSLGRFDMTVALERSGLFDVLSSLSQDQVIVLASGGDVSAVKQDAALVTAMKAVGASSLLSSLSAEDGYVLIGSPGLGEGNGLEAVAGTERGNVADLATVLVDGAVMGVRTIPPVTAVTFNYAGSTSQAGPASDLACTGCVAAQEIVARATLYSITASGCSAVVWGPVIATTCATASCYDDGYGTVRYWNCDRNCDCNPLSGWNCPTTSQTCNNTVLGHLF